MNNYLKGILTLIFIIIFISSLVFIGIKLVRYDQSIEQSKENFCNSYNMKYRTADCGFGCWIEQCYGKEGAFELEEYGNEYIIIGYSEYDFAEQNKSEEENK